MILKHICINQRLSCRSGMSNSRSHRQNASAPAAVDPVWFPDRHCSGQMLLQVSAGMVLLVLTAGMLQDVAERIGREAKLRHYHPRIMAMDAFPVTQLPQWELVVFVASTTGQVGSAAMLVLMWRLGLTMTMVWHLQGELPTNMRKFWRFLLRKSLPSTSLQRSHTATFGLGDSGKQAAAFQSDEPLRPAHTSCSLGTSLHPRRVSEVQCGGQETGKKASCIGSRPSGASRAG